MDLPTYKANAAHHRASLIINIKYWQIASKEKVKFGTWFSRMDVLPKTEARIRRDLESLNGMDGEW